MELIKVEKLSKSMRKAINSGFSLIELLVAVAVISVLSVLGFIGYTKYIQSAQKATNESNAKALADALTAEVASPMFCKDSIALNDPNNFNASNNNSVMAIVVCANTILAKNNFLNPYGGNPYGILNNSVDGQQMVGDAEMFDLYSPLMVNADGSPYTGGVFVGYDANLIMNKGSDLVASGPIFCSDQLNGNPVLINDDRSSNATSPATGLMLVVDGLTKKFGVASCDPYSTNPNGVIGAIFTIKSDMPSN